MDPRLETMRKRLNVVSPSFCLAKWMQVTMHLHNGQTHSCHHPGTHAVPLAELARNPSALHNTRYKKERRREMLTGVRPRECDYCWQVEDASPDNISDRVIKSADPWAEPSFAHAQTMPWDFDVAPTYVEVSFSSTCNFRCSYCGPRSSSKWAEEIKQHGPYPTSGRFNDLGPIVARKELPIPESQPNPYVDAFWNWWPDLYPSLRVFRLTGGEPLLSKHTMRVLEWIVDHPHPDLELAVNTNLGVPDGLYRDFLQLVATIVQRGCVRKFELYTSVDAHGHRAEYIRNGLDYQTWLTNVRRFFEEVADQHLIIMSTFNALSVTSFARLYADVLELRSAYPDRRPGAEPGGRIRIDLPYLRYPEHQSVMVLPPEYGERMDDILDGLNSAPAALEMEVAKFSRIRSLMSTPWPEAMLSIARANFFWFFSEHDRRRGTNFLSTFPEMASFWRMCRELAGQPPLA
jgi:organic radical activating enzyme